MPTTDLRLASRPFEEALALPAGSVLSMFDPKARLLIVDDEPHICSALTRALSLMGYQVEAARSGRQALALLEDTSYDLMVLDLCMPEMDGIEVMAQARQLKPGLLIIILTGHASLESAITAVRTHAVDYLLKPAGVYDIAGAVARALERCAEQLRKQQLLQVVSQAFDALHEAESPGFSPASFETERDRYLHANPLVLDRHKRVVIIRDAAHDAIDLTESEAAILASLMEHPDQVLSCRELARAAWGYDLDECEAQGLVRPHIFRLRHKIEATPNAPQFICTIRGRGYFFAPA